MSEAYTTLYGEDLVDKLKSDLRGDFEDTTVALMTSPPLYDARLLRGAMKVRFAASRGDDKRAACVSEIGMTSRHVT